MPRTPLFTRPFCLLILGHLLQALGFSSMLLLPLYLDHLDASRTEIGMIMAAANVGGLASRPLVGWALDVWGRKPTLLVGTAFLAASMAGLWLVHEIGPLVYFDRICMGVGTGTLFAGYFTWAADMIPESRRTEGVALFGISGLLPLGFLAFVDNLGFRGADLRLLFVGLSGVIALSAFTLLPLRETPRAKPKASTEPGGLRAVLAGLVAPRLRPVWLATGIFSGLVGVFFSFATVSAKARGVADPAFLWLMYSAGAVTVRLFGARLPDRVGPTNMVAPALGLYLSAILLVALTITGRGFALAGLLAGLGHGYCFPVLLSQVVTRSAERWRGSAISMFTAVWGVCEFSLPPLAGAIADGSSDAIMYMCAALGALAGLVTWCAVEHRVQRNGDLAADPPLGDDHVVEGGAGPPVAKLRDDEVSR